MQQYLDLLQELLDKGEPSTDRTGVGTLRKVGHMMRFNLQEGFPLLTTKKMFIKGTVEELLWFLRGSTDVKELQARGVNFWNSWVDELESIGHGYGKQFRNIESIVPVIPKLFKEEPLVCLRKSLPDPKFETDTGRSKFRVGTVHKSKAHGDYVILEELPPTTKFPHARWNIGFTDTGTVRTVEYQAISGGLIKDPYARSVFGVGYYGAYDSSDPHYQKLVDAWRDMLRRCYYAKPGTYESYGGRGIHVAPEWHCFANFQVDAKGIPGWSLKLQYPQEYSLDKDVLWASNRYSKRTCCWASYEEQCVNRSNTLYFTAVNPEGITETFQAIGQMCREKGLNLSAVHRCLRGKLRSHHGWRDFQYMEVPEGQVLRYRRIDQTRLALAELLHNPSSRRNIIALWNPQDMDRTTLPCCHGSVIQLLVVGGKLSLEVYQRSCDVFLGVPVNIASYALLCHMFAQQAGLEVGDLVWVGGDVHLYKNHIEQATEQLSRKPMELPKLMLHKAESLFDYKYDDVVFCNYHPQPSIKAEVAV